jgi:hypothetical protein
VAAGPGHPRRPRPPRRRRYPRQAVYAVGAGAYGVHRCAQLSS